jgi:carbon storage regulator CsrA
MLVLTRKVGEKIILRVVEELPAGTEIELTTVHVQLGRCRLGIDAPPKVHIVRSELIDRRKAG